MLANTRLVVNLEAAALQIKMRCSTGRYAGRRPGFDLLPEHDGVEVDRYTLRRYTWAANRC